MSDTKKIRVYRAEDGWRWQKVTSSDITADSGQAYDDKAVAIESAQSEAEGTGYEVVITGE